MNKYAEDANKKNWSSVLWDRIKGGALATGKHLNANKYAYAGGIVGGAAGVPVGLSVANATGMSATEKLITTLAASGILAGAGAYYGHTKDASDKNDDATAADNTASDAKKNHWYDSLKKGVDAVGDHLNGNKYKYMLGAGGAAAGVAAGPVIGNTFNMTPTERLLTTIAASISLGTAGVAYGHHLDTK